MKQVGNKKINGFSLVELIITLFAASLLMTLLMQQYLLAKRQYTRMKMLLEQNLELHLVNDVISNSLRSAGFTPCVGVSSLQSLDRRSGKTGLLAVEVLQDNGKGLQINKMNEHFATVERQINPKQLLIKGDINLDGKLPVLIADCYHAEVHEVIKARKTNAGIIVTLNNPLAFNFVAPVYLGEWMEEVFFVKKNQQNQYSLFYKNKHAEILSSLINSLTVNLPGNSQVEVGLGLEKRQHLLIKARIRAG